MNSTVAQLVPTHSHHEHVTGSGPIKTRALGLRNDRLSVLLEVLTMIIKPRLSLATATPTVFCPATSQSYRIHVRSHVLLQIPMENSPFIYAINQLHMSFRTVYNPCHPKSGLSSLRRPLLAFNPLPPQPRPSTPSIQPVLLVARSPCPATERYFGRWTHARSPALGQKTVKSSDEISWQRMLVDSAAGQCGVTCSCLWPVTSHPPSSSSLTCLSALEEDFSRGRLASKKTCLFVWRKTCLFVRLQRSTCLDISGS